MSTKYYTLEYLTEKAEATSMPGPKRELEILSKLSTPEDRELASRSAWRRRNMVGGRYSDALAAEVRHVLSGHLTVESFAKETERLREMGY